MSERASEWINTDLLIFTTDFSDRSNDISQVCALLVQLLHLIHTREGRRKGGREGRMKGGREG